jgi:capsid assembly protease
MSILIRIAERVLNRPLMILPDKLALIASVLEGRIGIDASDLEMNETL